MTSLDVESDEWMWEELEASRIKIERMFSELDSMVQRYATYCFNPSGKARREVGNPAFEILSTMQSQICSGDPAFIVEPQRSDDPTIIQRAIGLQFAGNRNVRNIRLKKTLQRGLVDFFFRRAAFVTERQVQLYADRGPLDGPPYRPTVRNIGMKDLRYDARTKDLRERRWTAHPTLISKGTLLDRIKRDKEEKGWDEAKIEALEAEANLGDMVAKDGESLKRDDFVLWSVWTPDEQVDEKLTPEMGYWGSWRYFAQTGVGRNFKGRSRKGGDRRSPLTQIREPQPCFTSRTGPYTIIGQFDVPDEAEPLSLMVATEQVARELGLTTRVIINMIRDYKRVTVYGGGDPSLARKIKNQPHGGYFHSPNFDPSKAQNYETGGVSGSTMTAYQWLTEQFWKTSGMTEAMLGQSATGATATADTLAAGGASSRIALIRNAFYDGVAEIGASLFEIIDADDRFFMRIPPEVQQQMGYTLTQMQGGRDQGQSFEDYDVKLMPVWMRHRSEDEIAMAAEQEWSFWERFSALAMNPTAPALNLRDIIRDRAMQTERPNLDARVNYQLLEQIQSEILKGLIQAGQGASQTNSAPTTPISARDSGAGPKLTSVGGPSRAGAGARGPGKGPATPTRGNTIGDKAGRVAGYMAKTGKVA